MKNSSQILLSSLFFFLELFCFGKLGMAHQNKTLGINVGVVHDMDGLVGKVGLSCMSMALCDFYSSHSFYKTRLLLHIRDSNKDVVGAASAALDLLKNVEVQAIIGPVSSAQTNFIVDLGSKTQVPIVSFSATSPSLSSARTPYFVRTAQNDSAQVKAIAAIIQAFKWREVVLIYEDTDFGNGIIPYLIDAFQDVNTRIPYRSVIPISATDDQILEELYKLMTMQTRVFIVHMKTDLGSRLFLKAKAVGMMSNEYSWIITDGLTNLLSSLDSSVIDSMQGVLGVRPYVPRSKELKSFRVRWKRKFLQDNPDVERAELSIFGLWAYDTVWALAMAAEKIGRTTNSRRFIKPKVIKNSSDLATMGVSQIGPKLLQEISNTTFKGLSGEFILIDGQLQSFAFQILNVIGDAGSEVGFWTPTSGISRRLNRTSTSSTYSTCKDNLRAIIWPGESTVVPKGWVIPTNTGKKLRIGVPVKDGFSEFLMVTRDPTNNSTIVDGYCIAVFKAVIERLPYKVPYEFIPFQKADGTSAGTYDDLVYQVYLQKFDAVVGDTTIIANRSLYVDFTLPYTETGVSLLVPVKDDKKNGWIFLKPLTRNLWLTVGAFFIFTGFVIWVLEHRVNDEFRGPAAHQFGVMFWFSFSTLVFAHKERVVSNLARFVVIIWIFVVLVLTSSYTASLTSMLTIQELQPMITDIKELKKRGEFVGYQTGSFVNWLLKEHLGFDDSKLKSYKSAEEFDQALSLGSQNGGIAAVLDEIPYINLLRAKYCAKYVVVGPTYKTDGLGFVFPRGSPLVPHVSRAILNVTEGDTMEQIVNEWFGNDTSCPDSNNMVNSNSLTLDSFWGLFLIVGVSSILAVLIYSVDFYYKHRHIWRQIDPEKSIWQKLRLMARQFDQKDISSHAFRKAELQSKSNIEVTDVEALPSINAPRSSSSFTNQTEGTCTPFEDQENPSVDFGNSNLQMLTSPEIIPSIELSNPNTERPADSSKDN